MESRETKPFKIQPIIKKNRFSLVTNSGIVPIQYTEWKPGLKLKKNVICIYFSNGTNLGVLYCLLDRIFGYWISVFASSDLFFCILKYLIILRGKLLNLGDDFKKNILILEYHWPIDWTIFKYSGRKKIIDVIPIQRGLRLSTLALADWHLLPEWKESLVPVFFFNVARKVIWTHSIFQ